ncbi:MAG: hypothetical protein ACKO6Q_04665 [Bacteroidota bacterium]
MSNRSVEALFLLIKSLEKAEKRHFKLYINRSSNRSAELKVVRLFDLIDKQKIYNEDSILKRMPGVTKSQLANLKTHLYREILASLRLLKRSDSIDLEINEWFDYAHILYKKGLFLPSLRMVDRAKELARAYDKINILPQLLSLEKRIESLHITRQVEFRADDIARESTEVAEQIHRVSQLSNLALKLFNWFVQNGHARDASDEAAIRQFLREHLPTNAWDYTGFYERLYLYQSLSWYAFIRQDFLQYYRYAQKWVDLFLTDPAKIRIETGHYIKGLHTLLNAQFDLRHHRAFRITLRVLNQLSKTERIQTNDNFRVQCFIYLSTAQINQHFMEGSFSEGMKRIPLIEAELDSIELFADSHQLLVLDYKFAMLCFGGGDHGRCISYLRKIIDASTNLRYDLQCYARLLHLLAHYELGNDSLMESLTKSTYRFMAKMKNLTAIEEAMFRFLRRSLPLSPRQLKPELEKFLDEIKHLEGDRFQTRAFAYLDIISWLESKVQGKSMTTIVRAKYLASKRA